MGEVRCEFCKSPLIKDSFDAEVMVPDSDGNLVHTGKQRTYVYYYCPRCGYRYSIYDIEQTCATDTYDSKGGI